MNTEEMIEYENDQFIYDSECKKLEELWEGSYSLDYFFLKYYIFFKMKIKYVYLSILSTKSK
jgi:hypothetical protein